MGHALVALMVPWGGDRAVNQMDEKLPNIVAAGEGINRRLGDLEARTGITGNSGPVSSLMSSRRSSVRLKDLRSRT